MINIASADYSKLKKEYLTGNISYRELAKKHGVPFGTLKRVAAREQWTRLRAQTEHKMNTKIVNDVSKQNAKIDDKYFKLVDMLLDKAEDLIVKTPVWQPTMLKEMATTMKYLKECKGVKSEADMREQEARIAKLQKEAMEEEKDTTVIVQFEEDISKWSK